MAVEARFFRHGRYADQAGRSSFTPTGVLAPYELISSDFGQQRVLALSLRAQNRGHTR